MTSTARKSAAAVAVLTGMLFVTPALPAQTPRNESQIPLFPGARVVERDTKGSGSEVDEPAGGNASLYHRGQPMRLRGQAETVYEAAATPEEVFAFYRKALGGKHEDDATEQDDDYQNLPAAGTTTVLHSFSVLDADRPFNDVVSYTRRPALTRARRTPLPGSGEWIEYASFRWKVKEANDDITAFYLTVTDYGFTNQYQTYARNTQIEIQRISYMTEAAAKAIDQAKEQAEHKRETDALMPEFEKAPTEAMLGVPAYPGATYDARNSAGLSTNETRAYVFLSDAAPDAVAKFYQMKTGNQPTAAGARFIFVLEGAMPRPQHAVMVQPNQGLPGPARTIITVMRAK